MTEQARIKKCSSNRLIFQSLSSFRAFFFLGGWRKMLVKITLIMKTVSTGRWEGSCLSIKKAFFAAPFYLESTCNIAGPVTPFTLPYVGMNISFCCHYSHFNIKEQDVNTRDSSIYSFTKGLEWSKNIHSY